MFRRLREIVDPVTVTVDGRKVLASAGDSVAAALLAAGITSFRLTERRGAERGPLCAMGVCFDCLVSIDGAANRQACLIPVADGMVILTGGRLPDLAGT